MRERARLPVDVSELLRNPGTSQRLRSRYEMDGLAVTLARVEGNAELQVDLQLDALVDGIHAGGEVAGGVVMDCRRCLTQFSREVATQVEEMFFLPELSQEKDDYLILDDTVDLAPMLRDAMVLALPLHPLCREDCRGLCPTCGADRNTADCGHDARPADLRWGPLGDLRRRMMEE